MSIKCFKTNMKGKGKTEVTNNMNKRRGLQKEQILSTAF
jgi:hypothetical protein